MDIFEKLNKEIEACKSMMRSIYAYGELTPYDNYLVSYKLKLGNLVFDHVFEEHSKFLNEHFKRKVGVYTDGEGCTYNELVQIKPTKEEIIEEMQLHNSDEAGIDNQWTFEDAEYHLLLSDKYHNVLN